MQTGRPRRSLRFALAAAAAALVVPATLYLSTGAASAAATNLVGNAGFESGNLTGWTCDSGTGSVVTSPVHSGSYALAGAPTSSDDAQCTETVSVQAFGLTRDQIAWGHKTPVQHLYGQGPA